MSRAAAFPKKLFRHVLTAQQQRASLLRLWPELTSVASGKLLTVRGRVRPTSISQTYRIHLSYKEAGVPHIWVGDPELVPRSDGKASPHFYPADDAGPGRPCLYYWKEREWTPDRPLATTVLPWLVLWLLYYELWHATGDWHGGGVDHPETKTDARPNDRAA